MVEASYAPPSIKRAILQTVAIVEELVKIMVEHDMEKVAVERAEENIRCNLEEYLEKGVVK